MIAYSLTIFILTSNKELVLMAYTKFSFLNSDLSVKSVMYVQWLRIKVTFRDAYMI